MMVPSATRRPSPCRTEPVPSPATGSAVRTPLPNPSPTSRWAMRWRSRVHRTAGSATTTSRTRPLPSCPPTTRCPRPKFSLPAMSTSRNGRLCSCPSRASATTQTSALRSGPSTMAAVRPVSTTGPMTPSALAWWRPAAPTASRPRRATRMATGKSNRGTAPTWCASVAPTLPSRTTGRWPTRTMAPVPMSRVVPIRQRTTTTPTPRRMTVAV